MAGRRALLLDDTYVSGARAQSAAAALRRAGRALGGDRRRSAASCGRTAQPSHAAFLDRHQRGATSSWPAVVPDLCCRCVQTGAPTE